MTEFVEAPALQTAWYPVAESASIGVEAGAGAGVEVGVTAIRLLGKDLAMWRGPDGIINVTPDVCPHRQAPLSIGNVESGVLTCAYHGWGFGAGGRCVAVPSSGTGAIPPAAHLHRNHVVERYGLVWVCLGEPSLPIPEISQDTDPAFRRINTGMETWAASAPRLVDNFMDFSHFPWVHRGTFGSAQDPVVPTLELHQLDKDFYGYAYEVEADNPEEANAASGSEEDTVHRWMSTGFALPFLVRSTIRYQDGLQHILLLCSTPIDDLNTRFTFVVWRNDDHRVDPEEIISFDRAIGAEDKVMLEQIPGTLPLDRLDLVSVQADKPSVEWRRRLAELLGIE